MFSVKTGKCSFWEPEWESRRKALKRQSLVRDFGACLFHFGTTVRTKFERRFWKVALTESLIRNLENVFRFGTPRVTEQDKRSD